MSVACLIWRLRGSAIEGQRKRSEMICDVGEGGVSAAPDSRCRDPTVPEVGFRRANRELCLLSLCHT